ncbi:T-box transcription factor TBX19 [Taenia crassiceps]|uniref:T-box transcription factor TBX19 n=1 Tax=Taenia crassiceps TaxID=6207 RepID=A0ABR4QQZ0_9CEST
MERGGNWPEEHRVIDQEAEALPTTPRLPQIEAFFAHLNDRRIPSPGVSGDSQAFPISRQYTEAPFTSSSYTTTTCQNTAPSLDIASTSQHHPYHRYLPYTASTQQQQWNDAYCMQQCQLPPQQQQISSDNAQQYPFYPSQLQDFQALPSFQSDSHLLPPAASTGFPGSSMPLTYADTSSISSSYTTTLRQDTAPLLDIAPTPLHHLHHRHLPYTASTQHQHICTHDTHSHSNPSTLGCIQDQRAYEQWGVAHYVEQHNLPQQHQQQQPVFHGNSQTSRGHTVTWRPSAAVVQNALQSSASRLASTSRMVVGSEGEQNGSEHEQLRGAGLGGAPAMLEAQQAPPNSSLTANVALRTDLLRIARSVCNAYPTPCSSERQRFSSICVAGVDYATPNSARRPAITLRLCDQARWQAVGNRRMEMVIGRGGKRIYPPLSVNVSGLEAAEMYIFFLDLMPIDQHTYKFSSDGWIRGGTTKAYPPPNESASHHFVAAIAVGLVQSGGICILSTSLSSSVSPTNSYFCCRCCRLWCLPISPPLPHCCNCEAPAFPPPPPHLPANAYVTDAAAVVAAAAVYDIAAIAQSVLYAIFTIGDKCTALHLALSMFVSRYVISMLEHFDRL